MRQISLVQPRLPRAGLGNMLLVWARAALFAEINTLPVLAPRWTLIRIGPWLRGERYKRHYGNLFSNRGCLPFPKGLLYQMRPGLYRYHNPPIANLNEVIQDPAHGDRSIFIFDQLPPPSDYFIDLKEHQPFIKQRLLDMIRPSILEGIYKRPAPEIGLHIRLGDYQKVTSEEEFLKTRFASTPLDWFARTLVAIREAAGYDVPATIFTDGYAHEVADLLKLPNVALPASESALSDLLTLARSKMILASSHSSFSSWATYLGQCPTLWHPGKSNHYQPILPSATRAEVYEGGFDSDRQLMPDLLCNNIQSLFKCQ